MRRIVQAASKIAQGHQDEQLLFCKACGASVGLIDVDTQGYRLLKHALAVSGAAGYNQHAFDEAKWISCRLLTSQASQGVNKFVLRCRSDQIKPLYIWIFTPDLAISSSTTAKFGPLRVMRIYWKDVPHDHDNSRLDAQGLSEGELEVPSFELEMLRACLEESAKILPQNVLRLPGWQVGLLERFCVSDVA